VETLFAVSVQVFALLCLVCAYPVRWVRTIARDVLAFAKSVATLFDSGD
jgi:hypothetical protein